MPQPACDAADLVKPPPCPRSPEAPISLSLAQSPECPLRGSESAPPPPGAFSTAPGVGRGQQPLRRCDSSRFLPTAPDDGSKAQLLPPADKQTPEPSWTSRSDPAPPWPTFPATLKPPHRPSWAPHPQAAGPCALEPQSPPALASCFPGLRAGVWLVCPSPGQVAQGTAGTMPALEPVQTPRCGVCPTEMLSRTVGGRV